MTFDLFNPPPPYQPHSDTSEAAAGEIVKDAKGLRLAVYREIASCGSWGATDEEIQTALDMNPSTQRLRRVELVRMGMVKDSGLTRNTRSGRRAAVWEATTNT